jgi:hypothetical protein
LDKLEAWNRKAYPSNISDEEWAIVGMAKISTN